MFIFLCDIVAHRTKKKRSTYANRAYQSDKSSAKKKAPQCNRSDEALDPRKERSETRRQKGIAQATKQAAVINLIFSASASADFLSLLGRIQTECASFWLCCHMLENKILIKFA